MTSTNSWASTSELSVTQDARTMNLFHLAQDQMTNCFTEEMVEVEVAALQQSRDDALQSQLLQMRVR